MLAYQTTVHERCAYTRLDSGVHKFVLTESSPEAVDEWINHLDDLYAHSAPDDMIHILVDSSEAAVQPLDYISQRSHEINLRYPHRAGTRTAFLYRTNFMASLARTFIIMLSRVDRDTVQFFPGDNREREAVAWLLADDRL